MKRVQFPASPIACIFVQMLLGITSNKVIILSHCVVGGMFQTLYCGED